MKIFHYSYWHDPRFKRVPGGPVKVFELASNLTDRGHAVYLFAPGIGRPELQTTAQVVAVPFIDLPLIRFPSFQISMFFLSLVLIARLGRPDIIYVRIMWSFLPMLLARLLSVPVLLEINDSPHRAYELIPNRFKRAIVRMIDRISFRLSDHFLPVTEPIAENMKALEGIPPSKLTVLPSGTNADLFVPMEKNGCCRRLGLDPNHLYVGFIGTFLRHQGIDTLIDAAPLVIHRCPDVRFLLIGDGPMRPAWEKKVHENGLAEFFIFSGHVPYRDVPFYLGATDLCVAPFLKEAEERSPVKIFDYLACGKPVVAADVGQTSSFFSPSGALITVEPEMPAALTESVVRLLADGDLRRKMGNSGREFIMKSYSRARLTDLVENISLKLAHSKK